MSANLILISRFSTKPGMALNRPGSAGEPRRVCRRLFGLSYAAMQTSSSMA